MEHVKISMTPKASLSICHVTQNDNGREVSIDFEDYTLTGAEDVSLIIRKPDGTRVETALENSASDFVIWSSVPSECDVVGLANCEIKAENDGVVLYSASFNMNIEADPYGSDVTTLTATGNPCTFETNLADVLQSLKCEIVATGGNGSPDSPIPLVGHSELNLTRCGKNLLGLNGRTIVTSGEFPSTTPRDLNGNKAFIGISMDNYFSAGIINSYSINDNQVVVNSGANGYGVGFDVKVIPNTVYTFSYSENNTNFVAFGFYDKDGNFLSFTTYFTFTTPSNCAFVMVVFRPTANTDTTFINPQVEFGSTATAYDPFKGDTATISFGQTVYGGVYDKSGRLTITHGYKKLKDLNWTSNSVYPNTFNGSGLSDRKTNVLFADAAKCNNYEAHTSSDVADYNYGIAYGMGVDNTIIYVKDIRCSTISDFITAITTENAEIAYELATPIVIDVPSISVFAENGVNNIVSDGGGDVNVTYIKKV